MEEASSHGRLDMAVRTGGHVYLFEFKVVEMASPGSALTQLIAVLGISGGIVGSRVLRSAVIGVKENDYFSPLWRSAPRRGR